MAEAKGRWEGSGWAQSRGSPTCLTGINLLSGDPPAFRFAKKIPATDHRILIPYV
jgi:hypothetical protein